MSDFTAVETVLHTYLESLYAGDADTLESIFLPEAHLYASTAEGLSSMSRANWLERVRGRASSKAEGHAADNTVSWIDVAETTAVARVSCALPPNRFTDTLCLLKMADGWKIIAKTYHATPMG